MSGQSLSREGPAQATWAWWLFMLFGAVGHRSRRDRSGEARRQPGHAGGGRRNIRAGGRHPQSGGVVRAPHGEPGAGSGNGVLDIVIGVLLIRHPIGGVLAIALLIGIWLIAVGLVRLVGAFEREQRVWNIVLALLEIAAESVIVSSPPIGFATLALLVGIAFIANGGGGYVRARLDGAFTTPRRRGPSV